MPPDLIVFWKEEKVRREEMKKGGGGRRGEEGDRFQYGDVGWTFGLSRDHHMCGYGGVANTATHVQPLRAY